MLVHVALERVGAIVVYSAAEADAYADADGRVCRGRTRGRCLGRGGGCGIGEIVDECCEGEIGNIAVDRDDFELCVSVILLDG
jgi:hypothetical protein